MNSANAKESLGLVFSLFDKALASSEALRRLCMSLVESFDSNFD